MDRHYINHKSVKLSKEPYLQDRPVQPRTVLEVIYQTLEEFWIPKNLTFSCAILPNSLKSAFPTPLPRDSGITNKSSSYRALYQSGNTLKEVRINSPTYNPGLPVQVE